MEKIKLVNFSGRILTACPICGQLATKEANTTTTIDGIECYTFAPMKCRHPLFYYKSEPIKTAFQSATIIHLDAAEIKVKED